MFKPAVHILKYGSLEKLSNSELEGALGLHVVTGLVVYERDGEKKCMVIEPGMICDFDGHMEKIRKLGLDPERDISHVLCTHMHQDHVQALGKYPVGTHVFHYGASSLLGTAEYGAKLYEEGFIEIPEIQYTKISNAHTHKDTIYIIDSENEGKVAFVGDLVFAPFDVLSKETQQNLDKDASVDPEHRYVEFKKWFENNPDVTGFYLGHADRKVGREEIQEYLSSYKL